MFRSGVYERPMPIVVMSKIRQPRRFHEIGINGRQPNGRDVGQPRHEHRNAQQIQIVTRRGNPRFAILLLDFLVHSGKAFGFDPCEPGERRRESFGHKQNGEPGGVNRRVAEYGESHVGAGRIKHLADGGQVRGPAGPTASERAVGLPNIRAEQLADDSVAGDPADNHAQRADQHHADAAAHHANRAADIHVQEQQHQHHGQHDAVHCLEHGRL
jgi:hypothetical protein